MEFDFSANTVVDNIDKVPQDFRGLYVEKEGKFALDSENPGVKSAVAAVVRLNGALKAARGDAERNKPVDLAPLSTWGKTPAEIKAAVEAKLNELTAQVPNVENLRKDMQTTHQAELGKRDAKVQSLTGQLHKVLVDNVLTQELVTSGVDDPELAMPFFRDEVRLIEVTEGDMVTLVPRVFDLRNPNKPEVRFSGVTGQPMTPKELVEEKKGNPKYARFWRSEAPAGGGTPPGPRPPTTTQRPQGREMNSVEKIAAGLKRGQYTRGTAGR